MALGLLATRQLLPFGLKAWQAMFLVGAAPAFLCVFILGRLKEPQRWTEARAAGARAGVKFGSYLNLLRHPTWSRHAWLGLIAFDVARLGGFARLHDWIRRCRPNVRRRASSPTAEEVVWSIDEACVWYVKRVACLQRSAIATWLLRRHGFRAELVIACRPLPFEVTDAESRREGVCVRRSSRSSGSARSRGRAGRAESWRRPARPRAEGIGSPPTS